MNIPDLIEQIKWMPSLDLTFVDVVQIIILSFALYYFSKTLYRTRAWILVKGLLVIGAVYLVICLTEMMVLKTIMESLFGSLLIAIVIMLQPELQRIVELIGRRKLTDLKSTILKKPEVATWYSEKTIYEIAAACETMGVAKTGALIVMERGIPLTEQINSGIEMNSAVSNQLLINIFEKNTPLHDGAIIIKNNRIEAATCYLPLSTNRGIDKTLGTRHRAALGISETTDCVVIVVSEETGAISFCSSGELRHDINRSELSQLLQEKMNKSDEKVFETRKSRSPIWMKILAPIIGSVVWISVMSASDPIITKVIENVPVQTINEEVLDNVGHAYAIQSGNTVNVKVQGKRSLVDNVTKDDLVATADFSEMSIVYAIPINVSVYPNNEDIEIVKVYNNVMKLSIEEMTQVEIPIETEIIGDDNESLVVKLQDVELDTLVITCPQSIAKTLDKAVLTVDAYGRDNSFISVVQPVIYDRNGEKISSDKMSLAQESIRVSVDVYEVKEVPFTITLAAQDTSADAYYVLNDYNVELSTIRIAADDETMAGIKEINIVVSPDINSENASSMLINIKQYIPDSLYLAKNQDDQLSVELDLTKYQKKVVSLPINQVKISGYDIETAAVKILSAPASILLYYNTGVVDPDTITIETLKPTIKVQETTYGSYNTVITITDIEGVSVVNELIAKYELSERQ